MTLKNYRACSPHETLNRINPLLNRMGITRLANITGLDQIGIPVTIAVRPNAKSMSLSQGKGISLEQSKVSALMETIESYHAENIDLPIVEASISEIKSKKLKICDVQNLPCYQNKELFEDQPIQWIESQDIVNNIKKYVPLESVALDLRSPQHDFFIKDSNGLASGNTYEEAISHSLCELIERDAYALWTLLPLSQQIKTKLVNETIQNKECQEVIQNIEHANNKVGIWNISSDIGIPTFLVRIISDEKPPYLTIRPASGFGCHPDKNVALIRALVEAAQSRLTFIAGARDDLRLTHYRTSTSEKEALAWKKAICTQGYESFDNIPSFSPDSNDGILTHLKMKLSNQGINEICVVDLEKEEFGLSVVKVYVPKLEGAESYQVMQYGYRALLIMNELDREKRLKSYA